MAFVGFQIKAGERIGILRSPILRVAAVAFDDISHQREQRQVDQGRHDEYGKCRNQHVKHPRDAAEPHPDNDDRDTEPLREIFS